MLTVPYLVKNFPDVIKTKGYIFHEAHQQ